MSNATLIDRWYQAVKAMDPSALADVTTDDIVVLWNGDPALIPWAGRHEGRDAAAAFFRTLAHHIEVLSVTPISRIDAADAVIVTLAGRWRLRDTDTVLEAQACNVFRIRDGRIAAYEVYNDTAVFAAALAGVSG